ncbi:MAG: YdiU family protein [Solirubrobacteraceae bacterium]|nr:YdiU family protein [Solirubrobacteraceae bacterium]
MSCTWRGDDESIGEVAAMFAGERDSEVAAPPLALTSSTYVRDLEGLYVPWSAAPAPDPRLLVLQDDVARELGADPTVLRSPDGIAMLLGQGVDGTVAQGYAGHQFGAFSPRLGDGRALLLGEVVDTAGRRRDVHLKGSGRTPWARGGDGKAAVGPMLREHVISEAMHALGIPTTRALAVIATGEPVRRETALPGAVLVRVAASHLRVGTFEYVAESLGDPELLARLLDHAIARHYPEAADAEVPALAFYEKVVAAQAELVARWMLVGFVHGVMNTDNMAISGESIDYGPCAFMERYDPETVFSSIDHGGRYQYGRQPAAAQWNLARLAEALLPLIGDAQDTAAEEAMAILSTFPEQFNAHWGDGLLAKLGITELGEDEALADDLLSLLQVEQLDWTQAFRALADVARGDRDAFPVPGAPWLDRWLALSPDADAMDRVNPIVIPRNDAVEDALAHATAGDLRPYERLVAAVQHPFDAPADPAYTRPADDADYVTYCGT